MCREGIGRAVFTYGIKKQRFPLHISYSQTLPTLLFPHTSVKSPFFCDKTTNLNIEIKPIWVPLQNPRSDTTQMTGPQRPITTTMSNARRTLPSSSSYTGYLLPNSPTSTCTQGSVRAKPFIHSLPPSPQLKSSLYLSSTTTRRY